MGTTPAPDLTVHLQRLDTAGPSWDDPQARGRWRHSHPHVYDWFETLMFQEALTSVTLGYVREWETAKLRIRRVWSDRWQHHSRVRQTSTMRKARAQRTKSLCLATVRELRGGLAEGLWGSALVDQASPAVCQFMFNLDRWFDMSDDPARLSVQVAVDQMQLIAARYKDDTGTTGRIVVLSRMPDDIERITERSVTRAISMYPSVRSGRTVVMAVPHPVGVSLRRFRGYQPATLGGYLPSEHPQTLAEVVAHVIGDGEPTSDTLPAARALLVP